MATKLQHYAQLADQTALRVTSSYQNWTTFLQTMARLYKYPYHEQLMIFAQRPDATACADYDTWNKQMRRYVRGKNTGIALIDTSGDNPSLKYVFDVSDTGGRENSRRPYLFQYRQEHEKAVTTALTDKFARQEASTLPDLLEDISIQLAGDYWQEHKQDILDNIDGSFLEDYDEYNLQHTFLNAAAVSTTYTVMARCGLDPDERFEHLDFMPVFDFNTPQTIAALGSAVSQSSEAVLRQIEITVKKYERAKITERSQDYERTDIQPERRLQDSQPEIVPAGEAAPGQVRKNAQEVPSGASPGAVEQPDPVREAVPPSAGDRPDGEQPVGSDDARTDEIGGGDGGTESQRPDEVGGADEHSESPGGGDHSDGAGVQLTEEPPASGEQFSFFPSESSQITYIEEAERAEMAPSAFSMPQEYIDQMLRVGSNTEDHRTLIAIEYAKQQPLDHMVGFLEKTYHGGYGLQFGNTKVSAWYAKDGMHIAYGNAARYARNAQIVSWEDISARIGELLEEGQFATNVELTEMRGFERRKLAETLWYMERDVSKEAKELGHMSIVHNLRGGFPEDTEKLMVYLSEPESYEAIMRELYALQDAYHKNPKVMRFRLYNPDRVIPLMEEYTLPRLEYRTAMAEVPEEHPFITEDEIEDALSGGSIVEGSKGRIYDFYQTAHTQKEKLDFLKDEFGTGGGNCALSRNFRSDRWFDSKGIRYDKPGCTRIELSWNRVLKYMDELMESRRFYTPEELAKKQAQDAKRATAKAAENTIIDVAPADNQEPAPQEAPAFLWGYNDLKLEHPDDIVLYQVGDFFEIYGEDAKKAAPVLDLHIGTRPIPTGGRVDMCGIPAHTLERNMEVLRQQFPVTVSAIDPTDGSRSSYSLAKLEPPVVEAEVSVPENVAQTIASVGPFYADFLEVKKEHPDYCVLVKLNDGYFAFENDAQAVAKQLNLDIVQREVIGRKRPVDVCFLPKADFKEYSAALAGSGVGLVLVDHDPDKGLETLLIRSSQDADIVRSANSEQAESVKDSVEPSQPTIRELYDKYKPTVVAAITEDTAYRNACGHTDRETAVTAGNAAIRRAILDSGDAELIRLYTGVPTFRNRLHKEAIEETYPKLHELLRPLSQDDIDDAIRAWNGSPDSKRAVVRYMEDHGRERNTAAWLSREYGGDEGNHLLISRAGSPEETKLSWPQVQRRIAQLIKEDRFFTEEEQDRLEDIDPIAIREALAERGIENGVVVDEEKHNNSPFIRQVMEDVAAIAEEESTAETVVVFPGEKTNLPYDIEIQALRNPEPELPAQDFSSDFADLPAEELDRNPISIQIGGEWKTYPNAKAAEEASYEEYKDNLRRNAQNFRITDDALGVGGAKTKYQANINAIKLLKELESAGMQASPEQQEILSRYVGWGGIPDAFDPNKPNWATEYQELKELLTPAEYDAARASTLNAHYTSPTVIRAIYEAVGNMGFQTGNILEPAMGVGNFFGMLPEKMRNSRLYGVELDSISGRIAQQLYPKANITVAGFETTDRRDFFDLAVGNVPFGQEKVNDRAYNKLGFSLHNYFFAKALDQVRPGGVVAFATSRYTMDAKSPEVRKYLAQRADLLGAIRLPNNAFKANAGTEVVSDIIFLQKRDRPIDIEPDWVHLGQTEDGYAINSYFIDHPEMVMGRNSSESTAHGRDYTVEPLEDVSLADQLHDAVQNIRGTYQEAELPDLGEGESIRDSLPADPDVKNYSYTLVDGEVYFRENSIMVRPDLNATAKERVKGMIELRTCVQELIDLQMEESIPDSAIQEKQAELNRLYDTYTAKYGIINNRGNKLAFSDDSSYFLLCALEVMDDEGNFKRKADMFTKRTIQPHHAVTSVDTANEALTLSIGEKARVDMEYMSRLTGKSTEELTQELRGVIFKDPLSGDDPSDGWQTADEYLSGNVRKKLRQAEAAAADDPAYQVNVEALRAAQPKDLDASEIEVRLGATWIDKAYIQQFMNELLDTPWRLRNTIQVQYSPYTAAWFITNKTKVSYDDVAAYNTYGTDRASAYDILEDSLNLRDVRIYDTIEDADGKEKRVLNAKETTLAAQKQQRIREEFKDWLWADPDRRQAVVKQYNEEMNAIRPREYDGSHITFAGMNPEITLREHQQNAIAHVLYGGNTLLAHEVGAGKTFEMVAAAMESKRLGLCQKSIFVVPNHLTEQWASEFLRLYPSANILVTKQRDFETHNRKKFCARIATGDYDAIIIGHSQFEKIPISQERQERLLRDQIAEITMGISEVQASGGERFTVKQLERTKKGLEARLEKLRASHKKDDVVTFEQLGVDRMFVDEAHSFKNLFLYTKIQNVAGLSTSDAQKSSDMFMKCRYMDEITGNRGVVFATGTPVSNSMTELYTMQRYLQYDRLEEMRMTHFDCWASRFGETVTALELAPEGKGYRPRTRFSRFFNLPELMNLFKEAADIKTADQLHLPVPEVEYHNVVAKPTEIQKNLVQDLSQRAADIHAGLVSPEVDNMLKITSDGRKLGLDQRLINPDFPDEEGTKVNLCVNNILQVWKDGEADKLTQLVFCDISTPKPAPGKRNQSSSLDNPALHALETSIPVEESRPFNVYDDIRTKLIAKGIPPEQIAFIHDANTDVKKKELFGKVRSGQVRVLIGSTSKMGAGTNCQDRLVAIHNLDCPWRPGDLAQRKGRIERQGNLNKKVHVFRYVTEGTFDAYLWQTVENKQKFISQIMSSKSPVRACDDVDETALSFAEIKALCAGDPRIKERMDLDVEVSRLKIMKADHNSKQYRLEDNLLRYFPEQISKIEGYIAAMERDMETLDQHPHPQDGFAGMTVLTDDLMDKDNAGAALIEAAKKATGLDPVEIGTYRGFQMSVTLEDFGKKYVLTMQGELKHQATLGSDARGNLVRLDNALAQMPQRMAGMKNRLEEIRQQQEAAKAELGKPFPFEEELRDKSARLIFLDAELNMDNNKPQGQVVAKSARPSVLDRLKSQPAQNRTPPKHKHRQEVR